MIIFPVMAASLFTKVVGAFFLLSALVLIVTILIQKGRGGGLGTAFAGGAAGSLFGSKTGDFLTWVTIVLVTLFLLLAVIMAKFGKPRISESPDTAQPPISAPLAPPGTVKDLDKSADIPPGTSAREANFPFVQQ